jgi:carbamoyl-phosphate synthase large subunit
VDTCAAEFEAFTPYFYSTYESGDETDPTARRKVLIVGGGPNRIGQGIEFDYCCCHACFALSGQGFETIMINCNPETVSTDYDTSDRLYFEPLTAEDVLEIIRVEKSRGTLAGVIVQFGGQTPLKLAGPLSKAGVPMLGTSSDAIDLAEDRKTLPRLLTKLNLKQPNGTALDIRHRRRGGARHRISRDPPAVLRARRARQHDHRCRRAVAREAALQSGELFRISGANPVLIDGFLTTRSKSIDAICDDQGDVFVAGIMEHIEEAGIHSGDSACTLPPHSLDEATIAELERQTIALARSRCAA